MQKAKNLLLILGNGFDLAHKESAIHQISEKQKNNTPHTSYTDFIKYLPFYQVRDRNNILNEANNKSFIKPSSFDRDDVQKLVEIPR
jgi:hypothetical protein